jgi:hypothetical protein
LRQLRNRFEKKKKKKKKKDGNHATKRGRGGKKSERERVLSQNKHTPSWRAGSAVAVIAARAIAPTSPCGAWQVPHAARSSGEKASTGAVADARGAAATAEAATVAKNFML